MFCFADIFLFIFQFSIYSRIANIRAVHSKSSVSLQDTPLNADWLQVCFWDIVREVFFKNCLVHI